MFEPSNFDLQHNVALLESLKLELRFLRIRLISDTAEYLLCGLTSCAEIYSIIYWNLLDSHLNTVQQPCVGERRKATTFQFGKYFADILVLDISKFINFIHFTGLLSL